LGGAVHPVQRISSLTVRNQRQHSVPLFALGKRRIVEEEGNFTANPQSRGFSIEKKSTGLPEMGDVVRLKKRGSSKTRKRTVQDVKKNSTR